MAGKNKVTVDLKIAADAQLKNSREFISQLDNIIDSFDFGEKINKQLTSAKNQLLDYNKILEKIQHKNIISDDEIKVLNQISKEMTNLVGKTERLYNNFSTAELQRFSKEYIAQVKKQEAEVAKIKQEYANKTGKIFDKEIQNLKRYQDRVAEIKKEIKELEDSQGIEIAKGIEQEVNQIQQYFNTLEEIKKIQEEIAQGSNKIYGAAAKRSGFSQQQLQQKVSLQANDVAKDVANVEYNKMRNIYDQLSARRDAIMEQNLDDKKTQQQLIALAKEYGLTNVSNTKEFEKQLAALEKQKNYYRLLDNRSQLATEQLITAEIERRRLLLQEQSRITEQVLALQKQILSTTKYTSMEDMKAREKIAQKGLSTTAVQVTASGAKLTQAGEEEISDSIIAQIRQSISQLAAELNDLEINLQDLITSNDKIAVQSERQADEKDIYGAADKQIAALKGIQQKISTIGVIDKDDDRVQAAYQAGVNNFLAAEKTGEIIPTTAELISDPRIITSKTKENYDELVQMGEAYEKQRQAFVATKNTLLDAPTVYREQNLADLGIDYDDYYLSHLDKFHAHLTRLSEMHEAYFQKLDEFYHNAIQTVNNRIQSGRQQNQSKKNQGKRKKPYDPTSDEELFNTLDSESHRVNHVFAGGRVSFEDSFRAYDEYYKRYRALDELAIVKPQLTTYEQIFEKTNLGLLKATNQAQYLGSAFDDILNRASYWFSLNAIFELIVRTLQQAVTQTKEIDKDMVQIGLVLGKTSSEVWQSFDGYALQAERLSVTTSELVSSMKLFYQQGLSTVEVNKMVEASAIAAALGESTMAEASETLTSLINSYGLSANEAMMVTDKISQISIISAADFGELSVAIEKVASSAASAGLDLDHMMGYLAKMIETTREAPTNIGTALKTIVANFSQFREDPTALTEDGTSINDVDEALASIGISLLDEQNNMRDLGEVIDELGRKWENLSRSQRSYLATMIAGTRQQSRFYALMNDYDRTLELVAEGSNSAGKASQQFTLYQNSLTSSSKTLANELEKLRNNLIQEDGLIHNLTKALTGLLKIVNKIPPIMTVLLGVGFTRAARKGANVISGMHQEMIKYKESVRDLSILTKSQLGSTTASQILRRETNRIYGLSMQPVDMTPTVNLPVVQTKVDQIKNLFYNAGQKISTFPGFRTLSGKIQQIKERIVPTDGDLDLSAEAYKAAVNSQAMFTDNFQLFKQKEINNSQLLFATNKALESQNIQIVKIAKARGQLNFQTATGKTYTQQEITALLNNSTATKLNTLQKKMNAKATALQITAQLKYIGLMAGITAVTALTKAALDKINKSEQENIDKLVEASNKANDKLKSLKGLMKQYDELNNKMTLTNQEMEEFINLRNQMAEEFPDLVNYYDREGNAVLDVTNALQRYNDQAALANENAANAILDNQTSGGKVAGSTAAGAVGGGAVGAGIGVATGGTIAAGIATTLGLSSNPVGWVIAGIAAIGALIGAISGLTQSTSAQSKIGGTSIYYDKLPGNGATKKESETYLNEALATRADTINQLVEQVEGGSLWSGDNKAYIQSRLAANDYAQAIQRARDTGNEKLANEIELYRKDSASAFADLVMNDNAQAISTLNANQQLFLRKKIQDEADQLLQQGKTDDEIKAFFQSQNWQNTFDGYRRNIQNVTTQDFDRYGEFIEDIASGDYSYDHLNQQINSLNGELQSAARETLEEYKETIKTALDKIGIFDNSDYEKYSLKSLSNLTNAYNNATDKEREFLKDGLTAIDNAGQIDTFMEDLGDLDTDDQQEVKRFKEKYNNLLGWYGHKFFDALFDSGFTLSKFKAQYAGAFKQTQRATANDISYDEIMTGAVSQENAMNVLTTKKTASNVTTVGDEMLVTGDAMRESMLEGIKKGTNELLKYRQNITDSYQTALIEMAELENKQTAQGQLTKSEENKKKALEQTLAALSNQVEVVDNLIDAYQRLDPAQKAIIENNFVITGIGGAFKTIESVRDLADAYNQLGKAQLSQLDIIEMVAKNSDLLVALQVNEQGQLELTKKGIEELTVARLKESRDTIANEIKKIEVIQAQIDLNAIYTSEAITELENLGQAYLDMEHDANVSFNGIEGFLYNFLTKLQNFGPSVSNVVAGIGAALQELKQAVLDRDFDGILERIKQAYGQAIIHNQAITAPGTVGPAGKTSVTDKTGKEYYEELEKQKKKLQAILKRWDEGIKNPGAFLQDVADGAGEFETVVDKLEKFYNYLRKLESIERRLTILQTKQAQLDLNNSYDLTYLEERNKLLQEQYDVLVKMIPEQQEYLQSLRDTLTSKFGEWISFDELGNSVLSQTEFTSTTEAEKERYDDFTELREEYEKQLEDAGQRQNALFQTQNDIIDNVSTKYDKINKQLEDEKKALTEIVEIEQHRQDLSFREVFALRYYESILSKLQKSYDIQQKSYQQAVVNLQMLDNKLRDPKLSKWVEFNDLTQQWEHTTQYTMDLLNEDKGLMAQLAYMQSLLKSYSLASEYLDTARNNVQEIEDTIKSTVDNVLSDYEDVLGSIVEQNTKLLDTYQRSLDIMERENGLYEGTTKNLQEYYDLTIEAAGAAKYAMKEYQENAEDAIDTIMNKYGEYVTAINGQYAINEIVAKENLTTEEITKLQQLLTYYNKMNEAANESQDQFLDYMDAIKEMEEAKRDAIINVMQQLRDELEAIDQKELDDLQKKYDEMNRLDDEYYSSLSQKIDDARKKRDRQQSAQDVSQLRNQIAVLERDSSGAFSTELRDLRQQLTDSLQEQADQNIDDELERIEREQEERQKDREIQIAQMENLINFKVENGMYWDQAYALWESGRASVESFLAAMYNRQDLSKEEIAQKIQETNATLDTAWVEYGNINAQKVGEVISPIAENLRELKTTALPEIKNAIDMNEGAIETATTTVVTALENIESAIREIYNLEDNAGIIEQMMENGKLWADASPEEKKRLNNTNKALGSKAGLTYDAPTGLYYDKYGQAAYNGTDKTQYNPKYDIVGMAKASEQMQANGDQWRENMTPSEKNALHEKNVKLAAPYGWYYDPATGIWYTDPTKKQRVYDVYEDGGYVDYTGFAKVDGTPSKPEAFLNAQQTQLFEQLRDSLAGKKLKTTTNDNNSEGDNIIINNLEISVKEIADADSIDKVVKTVKQSIYKDATATSGITKVSRR